MLRRTAVGTLLGSCSAAAWATRHGLDTVLDSPHAAAVLVDVAGRRLIAVGGAMAARQSLQPPGSTVKPFVLASLLASGRWKPEEKFPCPRSLRIGSRSFDCVHPPLGAPLTADLALAYSCNCFVAHAAQRFHPGELAHELERFGLASPSGLFESGEVAGRIRPAWSPDAQRMQALGEDGIEVTAAGLAHAYRLLALKLGQPPMQPIRKGLEGAVQFGTAQHAAVNGTAVAGKTGSAMNPQGEPIAWFAGFLPLDAPRVVLSVMLPGRSGGADAAPAAHRIFEAYLRGTM